MASTLGAEDVQRIAALARLELTSEEIALFTTQLGAILNYVEELGAVNTSGVEPTSHPLSEGPIWRSDDVTPSAARDAVLRDAPEASPRAGLFKVPKVL